MRGARAVQGWIALRRLREALGRWPTPRAHTVRTHNPEIVSARMTHNREHMRECDLRCARSLSGFLIGMGSPGSTCSDGTEASTAREASTMHQVTDGSI